MSQRKTTILLVDDQEIIFYAVKALLEGEEDIELHYCSDPAKALEMADHFKPTLILQDLVMPEIDGLMLVKYFRAHASTKEVPLVVLSTKEEATVKAEAFALGANDYMVKLPEKAELLARIRYHSRGYMHLLERNTANQQLQEELEQASRYVTALLPLPIKGEIETAWHFVPCMELGGDSFGYHWIDDTHFALYLLDVCGHGIGAALLSISVINVLRAQTLSADFCDPAAVLTALNRTFPMEKHDNMFFTLWYGVYDKNQRELVFASGGHPPAVLHSGEGDHLMVSELKTKGFVIGGMADTFFTAEKIEVPRGSRLYLFSDGVFELRKRNGTMMQLAEFLDQLKERSESEGLEDLYRYAQEISGKNVLEDDFSIVKLTFW